MRKKKRMEKVVQGTAGVGPIPKFNPCFSLSITTRFAAPNTFSDALGCDSSNVLEVDMKDDTIEKQRLAAKNKRRRALYAQNKKKKKEEKIIEFLVSEPLMLSLKLMQSLVQVMVFVQTFLFPICVPCEMHLYILFLKLLVIILRITHILSMFLHRTLLLIVP